MKAGACLVSEPPSIPDSADWFGSGDGLAAIYFNNTSPDRRGKLIKRAKNFVIAEWGDIFLISVYISPNADHSEFLIFLDDLSSEVRHIGRRTLVGGDFNSKSILWGCKKTDARGTLVEEWAAECDMRLINEGRSPTCVRPQGTSIIDLTWGSADLNGEIRNWRVENDVESLSDHQYILMELGEGSQSDRSKKISYYPRWSWSKCDWDVYCAAMCWEFLQLSNKMESPSEELATEIRKAI